MTCDCRLNFVPIHANIIAKDWETELDRIDISQQTSLDGKVEYWIALVGLQSRAYCQLRLPDDDDLRAVMEVTTNPRPSQSWELLAQYDETGRGRCFADVYVLLRQLGFDRWTLNRGAGEPLRHGLRSWTYCIFNRLTSHKLFRLELSNSTAQPLTYLWNALFPSGSDLRESTTSCPELDETEVDRRNEEWRRYKAWRQTLDDRQSPESDRTEKVLEMLEGQIKAIQSKSFSDSSEQ